MADNDLDNDDGISGEAGADSPVWTNHIFMVLSIATALAVTGLLFATFWLSRPYNMTPRTDELANLLEDALVENYVPRNSISREGPVPQFQEEGNKTTYWSAFSFDVKVPKRLNNEGLRKILRDEMSTYYVHMVEKESDQVQMPGVDRLLFYLDDMAFAEVRLWPSDEEAAVASRSDLREKSLRLAQLTDTLLKEMSLNPSHTRERAIPREDLNSLWNYTLFTATLPPGLTLGEFGEQLEAALPDAQIKVLSARAGDVNLVATLDGRDCVGLSCILTPGTPPVRPEQVTLDSVLENGIQGSEPDETLVESMPLAPMEMVGTADGVVAPPEAAPVPEETPVVTPVVMGKLGQKTRLAIIIDDGGNNRSDSDRILALDPRLTLAILPNTPYGAETASEGAELGFEVMLHMPMETDSGSETAVEGTLFTAMGKEEIQKLTRKALDQYPEVVGINNHTGSKFTSNAKKMGFVLEVIGERDLFFIDSYTMNTSVAYESAQAAGIPTARRDVFLDNEADIERIRVQFEQLVKIAIKKGSAIGIGHFQKENTARLLAEELPKLANAGIELVHASELLE